MASRRAPARLVSAVLVLGLAVWLVSLHAPRTPADESAARSLRLS